MKLVRTFLPRWLTGMVLALSVLGRVIVPTGFMVAPAAAGAVPMIVICTGQGSMTMPMPGLASRQAPDDSHDDHSEKAAQHPCAFAAASAAIDLTAIAHPSSPLIAAARHISQTPIFVQPGRGLAAPPPPKTGPPALN